jgi:folate-binding protein YgfZ
MSEGLLSDSAYDAYVAEYDLLRGGAGRYELGNSCLIEITGDDRRAWLQGQVTNDLRGVQVGDSIAFCVCSPTGQMVAACDMWSLPDRFLLRAHRASLPALLERLETMVVMEDVHGRDLTPNYRLICVQGPTATRDLKELVDLPTLDAGLAEFEGIELICLRSNRTGLGGWDLLLPLDAKKAAKKLESAFPTVSEAVFQAARLEAGIPRFTVDMDEKTLPPEMGSHFESKHVSYSKGCYTGQEVLMRLHARGHTNRTWVGLVAEEPLVAGDAVKHPRRPDAGMVTSAAFSPQFGYIAGAMLRNEFAFDGERVTVGEGNIEAEVRPFPLLLLD